MDFFIVILILTIGFFIQYYIDVLLALILGSLYRSYFIKALKVYFFSAFTADMILHHISGTSLFWIIFKLILITVWVWLYFLGTNSQARQTAITSNNATAELSHAREIFASYLYLPIIPIMACFPVLCPSFLHIFFGWIASGTVFLLQWKPVYILGAIAGGFCFLIFNPFLNPLFSTLLSLIVPRKK